MDEYEAEAGKVARNLLDTVNKLIRNLDAAINSGDLDKAEVYSRAIQRIT